MTKKTRLSNLVVNVQADALATLLANGFIDIYDGVQPDSADVDVSNQTLSVSLQFGSPAFMPAQDGVLAANPIKAAVATKTVERATWARLYRSDHKTKVMDVSVGTKDANIILPTTNIQSGVTVSCSSFTHSVAKATSGV